MPELPEVEAERRLLERWVVGRQISTVIAVEQGGGPRTGSFDDKVGAATLGAV
jgi:formamidopyrimidine-DNA glycosylase|tara:strand:+ start:169 stop:327 length:159 start_codon:yes stop_codon:yes gene_type:complete